LIIPGFIYEIIAGSSNGEVFMRFWEKFSDRLSPGDTVICDNVKFHCQGSSAEWTQGFLQSLEVSYKMLPKYSPELNPVELVFSMLKRCLKYNHDHSSILLQAILDCLEKITGKHVLNFYLRRGYLK